MYYNNQEQADQKINEWLYEPSADPKSDELHCDVYNPNYIYAGATNQPSAKDQWLFNTKYVLSSSKK